MKIKLVLDINKTQQAQLNAVVTGRQGDKETVTVNVFIVDSGVPYNLTGQDIYYEGLKPNNAYVRDKTGVKMINATQGNFEYTFRPETFGVAGVGRRSYFSIEQGGTVRASTQDFGIVTLADAMTGNTMSGPYISELEQLIQESQWLVNDINSRWTSINTQLTQLQNKLNTMDVVKRSGDTMTGNFGVQIPNAGSNGISFKSTSGLDIHNWIGTSTGAVAWQDKLANTDVFNYSSVSKTLTMMNGVAFNVAGSTNLLKKTGDTLTGHLSMDVSSGEKVFRAQTGVSTYGAGISFKKSGINLFDWGSNSNILQWDSANKTLDVANGVVNTNIVTKIKDGRANLTLTADALVIDANIPPLVNRRGNTVTFRCYMQRKVGSAGNLMTTLPVDMRPVDTVFVNALGHDGTVCRVTIGTDGNVFIGSGGKETEGKQIAETITYVVN
ncbi:phage baseplate upper protein [Bacillus paranthracis]|uniref:phage baseplate upper protein n=1 Tax=Bacillus paranthracis TaxID=2026186 RepID=UPI0021583997|nr:phage baseplate upper protein [Bacillus paranthracis]MCR6791698.1 phage baseplate upper protein [Bacillus paranthracis]MED1168992.1 phage baseplate upper protein [Bacillus paranthracis]